VEQPRDREAELEEELMQACASDFDFRISQWMSTELLEDAGFVIGILIGEET
jgi:hypothetical protein